LFHIIPQRDEAMLRRIAVGLLLPLAAGCGRPSAPALQPGDVVRSQIALAPEAFWPESARATVGVLLEVQRPGRSEVTFLGEKEVPAEGAVMRAKVTFLKGGSALGEPLEVPLVPDC
jgi:hypothetical protein